MATTFAKTKEDLHLLSTGQVVHQCHILIDRIAHRRKLIEYVHEMLMVLDGYKRNRGRSHIRREPEKPMYLEVGSSMKMAR